MEKIVLDSSVILKWFLAEAGRKKALTLRKKHEQGKLQVCISRFLFLEITNVLLYKAFLPLEKCLACLRQLSQYQMMAFEFCLPDLEKIAQVARKHEISAYDASYVVLARSLNCKLVTADKKLFRKTKTFSFVKLL